MADLRRTPHLSNTLKGLLRESRPWQWYKQGIMLLGITFSKKLFEVEAWLPVLAGVAAFTAVAAATYTFNDIADVEEDRNHRKKRHRPIASGQISVPVAIAFGTLLIVAGLTVAYRLGQLFFLILFAYLGQNLLYTLYLKELLFVDVLIVALGFVLRAIAGVVAIEVSLSPWLIVCTFLLALVFALGKRRSELNATSDPEQLRAVLAAYAETNIDQVLTMTMATLLMAYSLYTFFRTDPTMMMTLPFAFYGVFRYHHLVYTTEFAGHPRYLLLDGPTVTNFLLWAVIVVAVLYDLPSMALPVIR